MTAPGGRREQWTGLLLVGAAGLVWGSIPVVIDAADGNVLVKVFFRVLFAGIVISLWTTVTRGWDEVRSLPRHKLRQLVAQGAILTVNWALFFGALSLTNVATAELLGYMGPVFVAVLAPFVTKERFDPRIIAPMALALGGIAVIMAPQGLGVSGGPETLGAVLAFLSAFTYSVLLLRSKRILVGVTGRALMIVEYATASVLLLPVVAWLYWTGQGPTTLGSYGALLVLGVVHTAFAGILFLAGLRRVRTDHAAILTYTEPASAVVFAAIFLGQTLTAWTVGGGVMVVAGGAVVALMESRTVDIAPESAGAGGAPPDQPGVPRSG
jgi:drug/metabolite transporter (DMT)-like permease